MMSVLPRQVYASLSANLKQRYRGSIGGMIWVLLSPTLTYGVQCIVFKFVLKLQVHNYLIFLFSGLLPWLFIVQSVEMGTSCFVSHGRLLKSFPINPLVPLLAIVLDNLLNICLLLLTFLLVTSFLGLVPLWRLPLIAVAMLICFVATFGLTWILATLQVFYRDVRFVASFLLGILFYLTPVFYPESFIDEPYRQLLILNPFFHLILPIRDTLSVTLPANTLVHFANAALIGASALFAATLLWKRKVNALYFSI